MTAPFDIFQTEPGDKFMWVGTAETLDQAKAQIRELSAESPGGYLILNQNTGARILIGADGLIGAKQTPGKTFEGV